MTTFARIADGIVVELVQLPAGADPADYFHSDLAATLVRLVGGQNGTVADGWTYDGSRFAAASPPEAPDTAPARTYKADIWRRCSDVEAERLDAALKEAPVKLRRLWDDSTVIMHDAAEFPALRSSVAAIVGDGRADELLAASFHGG